MQKEKERKKENQENIKMENEYNTNHKGSNRKISMIFPLVPCCSCVNKPYSS